mmetsp:Transcript_31943/g.65800  ORF Transcript_31943/g.65800 Transcript_31943/m.65800 type:complete len:148 (+) Transcript_31943:75-518(+)
MGKFLRSGRVVVVLAGRYAGRKGVIVKAFDNGSDGKKFGFCVVVGIDRYPRKITRSMGKKKQEKRSKIKPFIKCLNYSHLMPTRYQVDITEKLKKVITEEAYTDASSRIKARQAVKTVLEERYTNQASVKSGKAAQGVGYFFKKLRF